MSISSLEKEAQALQTAFQLMFRHFGPCHWWPAETPWEVMVGAILTQNTAWKNVTRAIQCLKERQALDSQAIIHLPQEELAQIIRPAGYFKQKAKKLKALAEFLHRHYGGSIEAMSQEPISTLRPKLLSVFGIGPETADSILLYALQKPIFVVDAYTRRIGSRHGFFPENYTYHQIQEFFTRRLPQEVAYYNEYHALIVYTGKTYCRRQPRCSGCPLENFRPFGPST